jgi:hypothetical protein
MANRQFSRLSFRWRVILVLFTLITLAIELMMYGVFAREYYYLNVKRLRLVALTAVKMGAQYLPADPPAAVRVADEYAQRREITGAEIVFTEVSSDNNVLTIRLDRKIPQYVAVLALGGLPARNISVTASASRRGVGQPFGIEILDVPAAQPESQKIRMSSR